MSFLEPVELPKPKISPEVMVGMSSPLWAYFSAAAMGGLTYWWMTQWTRPANLEAMFGKAFAALPTTQEVEAAVAEAAEVVETAAAPVLAAIDTVTEELPPIGGESAPITATAPLEAAIETPLEVVEAVTEALTAPLETLPIPAPEPASFQAEPPEPEPLIAAVEPVAPPTPAPKPKKSAASPPANA